MKAYLIGAVLLFGLGGCLGNKMASPEVDIVEVERTRTVHEPAPPPEEVPVLPQSCLDALRYADTIANAASSMYDRGESQVDIISAAREALAGGEDLSTVENRQRRLSGHLVADLSDLSEALYRYQQSKKECENEAP